MECSADEAAGPRPGGSAAGDLQAATGRRDLAMLTLLARMGLRAGEVAGLALEDIDWRNGESIVVGKLSCRDRLALPADSGEAIAAYLQHGRPAGALDRSVFVRARAPWSCAARKLDHVADLAVYSAGGAVMVG